MQKLPNSWFLWGILRKFHSSGIFRKNVMLTSERYPSLKRGNYAKLSQEDVKYFQAILGPQRVIVDQNDLEPFNVDWMNSVKGASCLALKPKSNEEISQILQYCNAKRIAVCPQGGNTGLVGGSVPVFDEVVLSLQLMNKILSVDELTGTAIVEAGCVLENLENALVEHNLTVPLDLGAKGSCHIGGNIATNAGGIRLLRYGNLHGSVLGLTAILANGQVLECLNTNKKDNTGYDLKQLFIGSEGTLGVVTQIALHCPPKPSSVQVAFLGITDFDNVLEAMRHAKLSLGEILSSCELIDEHAMDCVHSHLKLRCPISPYPFYVLIETAGSDPSHDAEKLNKFLELVMDKQIVGDGTIATDVTHVKNIWALREHIAEALSHDGYVYKYDVSVPVRQFYQLVEDMRKRVGNQAIRCCGYGHLGDGNLHLNLTSKDYEPALMNAIEPFVFEWVSQYCGSISAEHGLGFKKKNYIHYSKSPSAVEWMGHLKNLFDPNHILNPYKVLPN